MKDNPRPGKGGRYVLDEATNRLVAAAAPSPAVAVPEVPAVEEPPAAVPPMDEPAAATPEGGPTDEPAATEASPETLAPVSPRRARTPKS